MDVSSLLESLNSGPCIFRTKDWWTYEVRPFFKYNNKVGTLSEIYGAFCSMLEQDAL